MNEVQENKTQSTLPTITADVAKAKLKLALNQNNFQKLQNEADSLVFNDDEVGSIKMFLKNFKGLYGALKDEFEKIKKPFLEGAKTCDAANREIIGLLDGIYSGVQNKYEKLVRDIDERHRKIAEEQARITRIKGGIESNLLSFSQRIAAANTIEDIRYIEDTINGEKGAKTKYAEFYNEARTKYEGLTDAIKAQKDKIRELEKTRLEKEEAEKSGDDEKLIELMDKEDTLLQAIEENKETVQTDAIAAVSSASNTVVAHAVLPFVKARYTTWRADVLDIEKYQQKLPEFLLVTPNKEWLSKKIDELKESGVLNGKEIYIEKGIKFYLDKKY